MKRTPLARRSSLRRTPAKRWRPDSKGRERWARVSALCRALDRSCRCTCGCGREATDAAHIERLGTRVAGGRYADHELNSIGNLIGLCRFCHTRIDERRGGCAFPAREELKAMREEVTA